MKIIISGGGTGGHIYPAIAIADAIRKVMPSADILFVGAEGRMEMEKVPKAGYKIEGLWISGFQRKMTWENLLFPVKVASSLYHAWKILRNFKPDAVVGTGGYASGAILRTAATMGIPTLILEQNSYPGVTNRLLGAKVNKICVAYEGMEKFFPKNKILLTGNPIRQDIENIQNKRLEALEYYGLDANKKTIVVLGGSLGARTINDSIFQNIHLLDKPTVQILWQTGKLYIDEFRNKIGNKSTIKITDFIERMDYAYSIADVIISRAGALSISELCLVGKPAILVPSPNVAEDHQTKNAQTLTNKKAAILVTDTEATKKLVPISLELLANEALRQELSENIHLLAKTNAANSIAQEVFGMIKK